MNVCAQCGFTLADGEESCRMCGEPVASFDHRNGVAVAAPLFASQAGANDDGWLGAWVVPGGRLDLSGSAPYASDREESAEPSIRRLVVRSNEPGGAEREFVLDGRDIAIGRSPGCEISLPDDQLASRRHALLRFLDGRYSVLDLGSSNGTMVNGREIREETPLVAGDHIKVGAHDILVSSEPASLNASFPGSDPASPHPLAAPLTNPEIAAVGASPAITPPLLPEIDEMSGAPGEAEAVQPVAPAPPPAVAPAKSDTGELESLQVRLNEIGAVLTQRAEEDSRRARKLKAQLRETRGALAQLLANQPDPSEVRAPERLDELLAVVDKAAESPYHLDYVTRLAARADEIATALRILAVASGYPVLLETLRVLLDELNTQEL